MKSKMKTSKPETESDLREWLRMIASLRDCLDWEPDEKPIEIIHTQCGP
ncbi:MAG TPA: hypothetical protein VGV87_17215 [Blastocatellia bacterium]|jgi:hypothetical protein|nr:hypothetical protein [Blastocatellia bacterium]